MNRIWKLCATLMIAVVGIGISTASASARVASPPPDCVGCTSEQTCDYVDRAKDPGWSSCEIFSYEGEWWCNTVGNSTCGVQQLEELASHLTADGSAFRAEVTAPDATVAEYRDGAVGSRSCDGTLLHREISDQLGAELRSASRVLSF